MESEVPDDRKRMDELISVSNKMEIYNPELDLAKRQRQERIKIAEDAKKRLMVASLALAVIFGSLGLLGESHISDLETNGTRVQGQIISFTTKLVYDPNAYIGITHHYDHYAIIETKGAPHQFKIDINAHLEDYHIGNMVSVIYDAQRPESAIIDRGVSENKSLSRHMLEFSFTMLLLGLWAKFSRTRSQDFSDLPSNPPEQK